MLEVHVKEERVATCLKTSSCVGHIELSMLAAKKQPKNVRVCAHMHTNMHTKSTTSHSSMNTHKLRVPMRQMRSERSDIKQPNLSCFAFIAPVHFHNALKPPLRRREGDMERRGER